MVEEVLNGLKAKLDGNKIPARIIEEDRPVLTVLFSAPVTDSDIYGDIFYATYGGDDFDNGLIVLQWEVADITGYSSAEHANLCAGIALLNTILPVGGYAVFNEEPEDDAEDKVPSRISLMYRIVLPVGKIGEKDWVINEVYDAIETSAAVLKTTAGPLCGYAKGEVSAEAFQELLS